MPSSGGSSSSLSNNVTGRRASPSRVLTRKGGTSLAWAGKPGQIYDVQLARDEAFQDLLVDQRIGEAALTIVAPGPGRYRLRIRATDPDGGGSPWSGTQNLQSLLVLPAWTLSAPAAKSP